VRGAELGGELGHLRLLPAARLDHQGAAELGLEVAEHRVQALAHLGGAGPDAPPEQVEAHHVDRHERQGHQEQPRTLPRQKGRHDEVGAEVGQDAERLGGDEVLDGGDVVGQAREDGAGGRAVVVRQADALEAGVEAVAQVASHFQADAAHDTRAAGRDERLKGKGGEERGGVVRQGGEPFARRRPVDESPHQQGQRQLEQAGQRRQPERENDAAPVGGHETTDAGECVHCGPIAVDRPRVAESITRHTCVLAQLWHPAPPTLALFFHHVGGYR
jgi:hypothetical protein